MTSPDPSIQARPWRRVRPWDSHHVFRIRVVPVPDVAGGDGSPLGPDEARVCWSADGGKTWKRVLFRDADTAAIDLILDPNNPGCSMPPLAGHRTPSFKWIAAGRKAASQERGRGRNLAKDFADEGLCGRG
ncbi:MAG: hypothetical protein U5J83_00725 [Bryobacterales bacterium]|nr:hypothetical protein [Bryobacterales bacterium]